MRISRLAPSLGALAFLLGAPAHAQPTTDDTSTEDEIVVTGTQIRGIAPTGAQVIGLDEEAIQASGATSTSQVLARIPQLSDFGGSPAVQGTNNFQQSVNRPALRNLSNGPASTAATLFLMDGHRLPGSGVLQTFADPDVIPTALLERVEVVPDGGSSIYGSDAVAGVVNFITLDEFDGLRVTGRHSFGDGFEANEASLALGRTWDTGSAFAAYSYTNREPVFGADREYVRDINWITGLGTENRCATPNVTIAGVTTAATGGPAVVCDRARETDLFSGDERHSALAGFSQELGESLEFEFKAWYTQRDVESNIGPLRSPGNIVVAANSPFSRDPTQPQTVAFSFLPVRSETSSNHLETWGIAPEIRLDVGHDWQVRLSTTYGTSETITHNPVLQTSATNDLQTAVTAGLVNPYNVADPTRLANVVNVLNAREWFGYGEDTITQVQAVADGPVFTLPAGEVRLAVGVEQFRNTFRTFSDGTSNFRPGQAFVPDRESRDVEAQFVELNIPILDDEMGLPFVHRLDISLSGRRDDYSDFGEVTTKRYGFTYEPVDWISVGGHWGDSFQAPGLADIARAVRNTPTAIPLIPSAVLIAPSDAAAVAAAGGVTAYNFFAVQGTFAGLEPQNAEAWNVGIDLTPPIFDSNLTFGATYWSIDYALRIGSALTFISSPTVYTDFADKLIHDPRTVAQGNQNYAIATAAFPEFASQIAALQQNGKPLYSVYDFRNQNTGGDRRQGIDVRASYTDETSWGTWFTNFNGTYFRNFKISPADGAPFGANLVGTDIGAPDWKYSLVAGVTVGDHWLAQLTWNHNDSVRLGAPLGGATAGTGDDQTDIDAFDTVDLYVQYDFAGTGLTEDLSLSFGVQNIADQDPPLLKRVTGSVSGFPLQYLSPGRVFQVGLSARF